MSQNQAVEPFIQYMRLDEIRRDPGNPKDHDLGALGEAFRRFGYVMPMALNETTGMLLAGHGRLAQLEALHLDGAPVPERIRVDELDGMWLAPVVRGISLSPDDGKAYTVADNRIVELGGWHEPLLTQRLVEIGGEEPDSRLAGTGFDSEDVRTLIAMCASEEPNGESGTSGRTLAEAFGIPPFSVLDARQGYWQERKRGWLSLGIRSEIGRSDNLPRFSDEVRRGYGKARPRSFVHGPLMKSDSGNDPKYYYKKRETEHILGHPISTSEFQLVYYDGSDSYTSGASIFDPVLCELIYRWFCPPGGSVLDPFAGGSVRGLVAAWLGFQYVGIELREEQVEANRLQAVEILGCQDQKPPSHSIQPPQWICGDSRDVGRLAPGTYDLLFSCPPYGDLETYSDDPRDLSTLEYPDFLAAYRHIIAAAIEMLAQDRFACFVVGDFRARSGYYRNFVSETIRAFVDAGMSLYNEAILVGQVGSLALRVGRQFSSARKLGKLHQNVLIFYHGDTALIKGWNQSGLGEWKADDFIHAMASGERLASGSEQ